MPDSIQNHFSFHNIQHYLKWLTQTVQGKNQLRPQKYDGLTSFILSIIILSLSFRSLFNTILNFLSNMFISAPSGTSLDEFGNSTVNYLVSFKNNNLLSGLLLISINFIILIGLSYYLCHWISHQQIDLWQYVNRLASLTNGALLLELIGLFLAIIGHGFKLVVILDLLATNLYYLGTVDNLWNFQYPSRQKRLYITTVTLFLYPICFLIVLFILIAASH